MIPSVFAGATAVYNEIGAEISNQTATAHKTEISAQARSKLEKGKKLFTYIDSHDTNPPMSGHWIVILSFSVTHSVSAFQKTSGYQNWPNQWFWVI